jgi:hypothetical protein
MVKSHYPERYGYLPFDVGRVVLLVRNPFDAIESYFNMAFTNTHDKALHSSARLPPSPLAEIWEDFVLEEVKVWIRFHTWWKQQAAKVPVLVVRFEDLRREGEISRILAFAAGSRDSELDSQKHSHHHGVFSRSMPSAAGGSDSSGGGDGPGYKPKANTLKVGKALSNLSPELINQVLTLLQPLLSEYGYSVQCKNGKWGLDVLPIGCNYQVLHRATVSGANDNLIINSRHDLSGLEIRGRGDKYGRNVTQLRHSMTDTDKNPFRVQL